MPYHIEWDIFTSLTSTKNNNTTYNRNKVGSKIELDKFHMQFIFLDGKCYYETGDSGFLV